MHSDAVLWVGSSQSAANQEVQQFRVSQQIIVPPLSRFHFRHNLEGLHGTCDGQPQSANVKKMRVVRNSLVVAALACLLASPSSWAAGSTQRECSAAYQDAQVAMKRAKLQSAREALQRCLAEKCSAILRQPCLEWLGEVETRQPTVLVTFRDANGTLRTDATLSIDGQTVGKNWAGTALPVDPGLRRFRIESPGSPVVEEERLVVEGEKLASLVFAAKTAAPKLAALTSLPSDGSVAVPNVAVAKARPIPPSAVISAGGSLLALGAFGGFALWGRAGERELSACRGMCSASQVDGVKSRYLAADISLGVAVGAGVLAAILFLTRPEAQAGDLELMQREVEQ